MKKLIFLSLTLLIGSSKLCFGDFVVHNKTNYPLVFKYTLNDLLSSWQKTTLRPLQSSRQLNTKTAIGRTVDIKKLELAIEDNEGGTIAKRTYAKKIIVNRNEVTHIYVIDLMESEPKIRLKCMKKGKITCTPYLKTDSEDMKMLCRERMNRVEKSYIISEKKVLFPNIWSTKIITNKTGVPIKVDFLDETFYLEQGDAHAIEHTTNLRRAGTRMQLPKVKGQIKITQERAEKQKPLKIEKEILINPVGIQNITIEKEKGNFSIS